MYIENSLLEPIKKLYQLELYEDLLLYADLNLDQYRIDKLSEDNQAFMYVFLVLLYSF